MNRKTSAYISLVICIVCAVVLVALLFTFPMVFKWLLELSGVVQKNYADTVKALSIAFYAASPFSLTAVCLLIKLLLNVIHDKVFVDPNVKYLRIISYCCYAVALICTVYVFASRPLVKSIALVGLAMVLVGTLLRVVKNVMQSAVELREENDLTI